MVLLFIAPNKVNRPFLYLHFLVVLLLLGSFIHAKAQVPQLGEERFGGVVFYVSDDETWGLVAAKQDLPGNYEWCPSYFLTNVNASEIGTGKQNTQDLLDRPESFPAAEAASAFNGSGYTDWFLPSMRGMQRLYEVSVDPDVTMPAGFDPILNAEYWTSSEYVTGALPGGGTQNAYHIILDELRGRSKDNAFLVRPVRMFTQADILPVTLTAFSATEVAGQVQLAWQTASESGNQRFVITRSANAIDFQKIGELPGKGNTAVPTDYHFNDDTPLNGTYYYRLIQVDNDGKKTYSPIVHIAVANRSNVSVSLSPNPVTGNSLLRFAEGRYETIRLLDLHGCLLWQDRLSPAASSYLILAAPLRPGAYYLQLTGQLSQCTLRMIKME